MQSNDTIHDDRAMEERKARVRYESELTMRRGLPHALRRLLVYLENTVRLGDCVDVPRLGVTLAYVLTETTTRCAVVHETPPSRSRSLCNLPVVALCVATASKPNGMAVNPMLAPATWLHERNITQADCVFTSQAYTFWMYSVPKRSFATSRT
jgi:hypothetical protein